MAFDRNDFCVNLEFGELAGQPTDPETKQRVSGSGLALRASGSFPSTDSPSLEANFLFARDPGVRFAIKPMSPMRGAFS